MQVVLGAEVSGRQYTCSSATGGALSKQRITLREAHRRTTTPAKVELCSVVSGAAQLRAYEVEISADEGEPPRSHARLGSRRVPPTAPVDRPRLGTSRDLALLCSKGGMDLLLLALGHLEVIKGVLKFRLDFVEHFG